MQEDKPMKDNYDFSKAIKNPFAKSMKKGYTIIIEHKDYDEIIEVKKTRKDKKIMETTKPAS